MDEEQLVLVDEDDNPLGSAGKLECHTGKGKLHRAFTALVFDSTGKLLLTKRSDPKMLWPGIWDATFASHPRVLESYVDAAMRRMPHELGTVCHMDYLLKFVYHVKYSDIGSENEVCGVLAGTLDDPSTLRPLEQEISEISWVTAKDVLIEIHNNPEAYCPWMLAALLLLDESTNAKTANGAIAPWITQDAKNILVVATRTHMEDTEWRLVK